MNLRSEYICDDRIKEPPEWIEQMDDKEIEDEYKKRFGDCIED